MVPFTTLRQRSVRDVVIGVVPVDCYQLLSVSLALLARLERSVSLLVLVIYTTMMMEAVLRARDVIIPADPAAREQSALAPTVHLVPTATSQGENAYVLPYSTTMVVPSYASPACTTVSPASMPLPALPVIPPFTAPSIQRPLLTPANV